jgi:hypothetical protein
MRWHEQRDLHRVSVNADHLMTQLSHSSRVHGIQADSRDFIETAHRRSCFP